MLKSIKTLNFKKLSDNTFDFTDSLNIICGDNAQGKTTLTQALMFALFGVKAVPGSADKIPTWGQKNCQVEVVIGDFLIRRSLKNCEVFEGQGVRSVATGNSVCSDYIEKHITGVDLKGFRMLNWSAQGETSALLTLGATQLQRDVEKFSGVEFIDEMIKLVNVDVRDLQRDTELFEPAGTEESLRELLKSSEVNRDELAKDISEEQADLEQDKIKLASLREILRQLEADALAHESCSLSIADLNRLLSELSGRRQSLNTRLEELKAQKLELGECISESVYLNLKEAVDRAVSTNALIERSRSQLVELGTKLKGIDKSILRDTELEEAMGQAEFSLGLEKGKLNKLSEQHAAAVDRAAELELTISNGVCETCGQFITEEFSIRAHEKELLSLQDEVERLNLGVHDQTELIKINFQPKFDQATQEVEDFHGNWKTISEMWEQQIQEEAEYLETVEVVDVSKLASELETAVSSRSRHETLDLDLEKVLGDIDSVTDKFEGSKLELSDIESNLPEKPLEETLSGLRTSVSEVSDSHNESVTLLAEASISLRDIEDCVKATTKQLEAEIQFRQSMGEIKLLNDFVQYLRDSRVRFLSSIWANILSAASAFLMQATGNRITALSKSDKEGFMFCEDGVFAPVASASGAQRGFIGVAVRLALAKSLRSSCPIVVLDEPTESMREENALRLSGSLLSHGQVIMVTHRESDKVSASNVVEL